MRSLLTVSRSFDDTYPQGVFNVMQENKLQAGKTIVVNLNNNIPVYFYDSYYFLCFIYKN